MGLSLSEQMNAEPGEPVAETLEQRIEREASEAGERYRADPTAAPAEERWQAAVRPLVERIVELESAAAHDDELAVLDGAEMAEMRAKLTAAQAAGRDQASEIERLREDIASVTAHGRRATHELLRSEEAVSVARGETAFERANVRDLRTTVRTLAGLLAARGQS
jgi:hypothetical protein